MLTRKTVILVKPEATYGVDPVPTPANNALLVSDVDLKVQGEVIERDFIRSSLSPLMFMRGIRQVELSFKTELHGTTARGTLPNTGWTGALFRACGMSETVTANTSIVYAPVSAGFESCAIYVYMDGIFHKILGCRGSFKLNFEVGKYPTVEFTMKGLYASPTDAAPGAQTFLVTKPVPVLSAGFSFGGYSAVATKLEIDINNDVKERKSLNSSSGIIGFEIVGRQPQGSFDPETVLEAAHPFWANWEDAVARILNIGPIGTEEGNILTVNCPKTQLRDMTYADRNGVMAYTVPIALAMSQGDDELTITIT